MIVNIHVILDNHIDAIRDYIRENGVIDYDDDGEGHTEPCIENLDNLLDYWAETCLEEWMDDNDMNGLSDDEYYEIMDSIRDYFDTYIDYDEIKHDILDDAKAQQEIEEDYRRDIMRGLK